MTYEPGQRVTLVHLTGPDTGPRPGDTGTVAQYHPDLNLVEISWDNGTQSQLRLNDGDLLAPASGPAAPATAPQYQWEQALTAFRTAGQTAGTAAADWWGQDTVGGRATGDVKAAARRILAGLDDGDPAVLDTLPQPDTGADPHWYTEAVGPDAPAWTDLADDAHQQAAAAYRQAFTDAVEARVAEVCRIAASPTGDGRDLSHLHPDRIRVGSVGVFSGDWAWTTGPDGEQRIPVGFVGTLVDRWNGWAVFTCTRQVAQAIVADQQRQRDQLRETLRRPTISDEQLEKQFSESMAAMSFDGDTIVVDQRGVYGDPDAVDRITPNPTTGLYVVMGWAWCWEAVDPAWCDTIVGNLPTPDAAQEFVPLVHTPGMRVPHERLRVTRVQTTPTTGGVAVTAALRLDGIPVGWIRDYGDGAQLDALDDGELRVFLDACRHQGRPVAAGRVLQALIDEYDLGRTVAAASDTVAVVRLLDDADYTLETRQVTPAPRGWNALVALARQLTTDPATAGGSWQIWTGSRWMSLPNPETARHLRAPSEPVNPREGEGVRQ